MAKRSWKNLAVAIGFFLYGLLILAATGALLFGRGFELVQIPILTINGLSTAVCLYFSAKRAREFFKRT